MSQLTMGSDYFWPTWWSIFSPHWKSYARRCLLLLVYGFPVLPLTILILYRVMVSLFFPSGYCELRGGKFTLSLVHGFLFPFSFKGTWLSVFLFFPFQAYRVPVLPFRFLWIALAYSPWYESMAFFLFFFFQGYMGFGFSVLPFTILCLIQGHGHSVLPFRAT